MIGIKLINSPVRIEKGNLVAGEGDRNKTIAAGILSAHRAGCHSVLVPDLDGSTEELRKILHAEADTLLDILKLI